jgi:hypothetical protein
MDNGHRTRGKLFLARGKLQRQINVQRQVVQRQVVWRQVVWRQVAEASCCSKANDFRGRSLGISSLGSCLDLLDIGSAHASAFPISKSFKTKLLQLTVWGLAHVQACRASDGPAPDAWA